MIYKKSIGEWFFDAFNTVLLIGLALMTLYPLLYVLMASVSDPVTMARGGKLFWSLKGASFGVYRLVFINPMIVIGYRNTLTYLVLGTILNFVLTSFGAYALSRRGLPGRKFFMLAIVFTMQFSGGFIPLYLLADKLGIVDKIWAMILPAAISTWNLIIMRTSFAAVPVELEESARLDGANDFTILFRLFIPVSKPVVATIIMFYAVYHWNSFFNALILLRNKMLYPLQLVLREILIQQNTADMMGGVMQDREQIAENIKYATIVVATLPILCVYPFVQKYFVKGVMIGSLKQ